MLCIEVRRPARQALLGENRFIGRGALRQTGQVPSLRIRLPHHDQMGTPRSVNGVLGLSMPFSYSASTTRDPMAPVYLVREA